MMTMRVGISRRVFLIGRYAIKVPRLCSQGRGLRMTGLAGRMWSFSRGVQANLSEREWSGVAGVAPVLWSFAGLVNIYPRCTPIPNIEYPREWFDSITSMPVCQDRKASNVGLLAGQRVWLDYDGSWNSCPHELSVVTPG